MKHLMWSAVTLAAFLFGLYLGQHGKPAAGGSSRLDAAAMLQDSGTSADPRNVRRAGLPVGPAGEPAAGAIRESRLPVLSRASLPRHLDRLDDLVRSGDDVAALALQDHLLGAILDLARDGAGGEARAMLAAYLERNPHDPEAYLLHSDLEQMQGRTEEALSPLMELLGFADDPSIVSRARDKLRLLVNAREAHLVNTGNTAALIRLFEALSLRDPGFDGHRLRLARWQLRAGRLADAERTLAETGTVGVDPRAREDLAAEIRLARASLPVERRGGVLHVTARVAGRGLRLLVDTGATTTAISRARAVDLQAVPTGRRVQVRTANGLVESQVHQVSDVEIGPLHLDALTVLVLEGPLPQGVDGLLGMDVLSRFPGLPGTGLPAAANR